MCGECDNCPFEDKQEDIVYEIHITVDKSEGFLEACNEIGVKAITLDLGEGVEQQVMTSSTYKDTDVFNELYSQQAHFLENGFEVKRMKIETVPWHPVAKNPNETQYFETHFGIEFPHNRAILKELAKNNDCHFSRNLMKIGERKRQMMTFRSYGSFEEHEEKVSEIKKNLLNIKYKIDRVVTEFALYDSNISLDKEWICTQR